MLSARVLDHLRGAGWSVDEDADWPEGAQPAPDFLAERGAQRLAVLVRDAPPGAVAVARFAAACRRRGVDGLVVCPDDAAVADLCVGADVDYLGADRLLAGPAPAPSIPGPVTPPPPVLPGAHSGPMQSTSVALLRWTIVVLVWIVALVLLAYDAARLAP